MERFPIFAEYGASFSGSEKLGEGGVQPVGIICVVENASIALAAVRGRGVFGRRVNGCWGGKGEDSEFLPYEVECVEGIVCVQLDFGEVEVALGSIVVLKSGRIVGEMFQFGLQLAFLFKTRYFRFSARCRVGA